MATKLKNLRLTSVDLVRAGANQEADICLYKSADPPIDAEFDGNKELEEVVRTWTDTDGIYADNIDKANPYHDPKDGKFTTGPGGGAAANPMIRQGPPPKNTKIAYKVFVARDGKLYPPMVANPDGQATPVGVWLNASEGKRAMNKDGTPVKNTLGRDKVVAGGKGTQGGSGTLAYRPGWHLGDLPVADQFYVKDKKTGEKKQKKNFVWAECEIAADFNYQEEAMSYGYNKNGKFQHSLAGLPKIPTDGYYTYRTNPDPTTRPWYITGAMRVKRILTDAETNKILRDNGIEPRKRDGGELDLKALGFTETNFVKKSFLSQNRFDFIVEVKKSNFDEIVEVEKFNPYHGKDGRFTSAGGGMRVSTRGAARQYGSTNTDDVLAEIRQGKKNSLAAHLDKNGKLTPEREEVHKQIIDDLLKGKMSVQGQPTMTMLGGGPASGKSSVMNPDTSKNKNAVTVDPDAIKAMLPGYKELAKKDSNAASYYHEESSALAKRFSEVAYKEGYDVIYDGTGDGSTKSVLKKVNAAKAQGYRVEAKYVSIDTEEAVRRNQKRYDDAVAKGETPRLPPVDMVRATHAKCTDISVEVASQFDHIEIWDNNGARGQQKLIATGGGGKGLVAVDKPAFDRYLAKGTKEFVTLPDGQVVPATE